METSAKIKSSAKVNGKGEGEKWQETKETAAGELATPQEEETRHTGSMLFRKKKKRKQKRSA